MYKTIAESNSFIVLDKFTKYFEVNEAPAVYQTDPIAFYAFCIKSWCKPLSNCLTYFQFGIKFCYTEYIPIAID
jgi:hypothetical protein